MGIVNLTDDREQIQFEFLNSQSQLTQVIKSQYRPQSIHLEKKAFDIYALNIEEEELMNQICDYRYNDSTAMNQSQNSLANDIKKLIQTTTLFEQQVQNELICQRISLASPKISNKNGILFIEYFKDTNQHINFKNNTFLQPQIVNQIQIDQSITMSTLSNELKEIQFGVNIVSFYKNVTDFIEKQIKSETDLHYIMKRIFIKDFMMNYQNQLLQYYEQKLSNHQMNSMHLSMVDELSFFIKLFLQSLIAYYELQTLSQSAKYGKLLKAQNLHNFILCEIFDDSISCMVLEVFRAVDKDVENDFRQKSIAYRKQGLFRTDLFEIPLKYELKSITDKPYKSAIEVLKEIQFQSSPVHKLKIIIKTFEQINETLQEAYPDELISIPNDIKLNLVIYVAVNCQVVSLNSHVNMIAAFIGQQIQSSAIGHNLTLFRAALSYIQNIHFQ